ncbi:metal-dependent hydrolase [Caldiplasma sukawensis]
MTGELSLTWEGHACFSLKGEKNIIIDPFLEGNPKAIKKKDMVQADIVLVTHGHSDHVGDAVYIARKNKVPVATVVELAWILGSKNEDVNFIDLNFSGSHSFGNVKVTLVPALHSSSYEGNYAGNPGGLIINMNGKTLYHAGDTGLFSDMKLIGEYYKPDVAMLPIGGHYTMSPDEAAKAVELINPKFAIPMHYDTFDLIKQDPEVFKNKVEKNTSTKVIIPKIGREFKLEN